MELKEFMLIFIVVDYGEMNLSPEEIQTRAKSWMDWQSKMMNQGILTSGNALQAGLTRISGPERTISDRMAVESKEIIGGYYIVQASDIEAVKEIAADYPDYDLGGVVEIREFIHYN